MYDETKVLQQRVQVCAIRWGHRNEAQKRVAGEQRETYEPQIHQGHDTQNTGNQWRRIILATNRQRQHPSAHNGNPQQKRTLVTAPGCTDLVVPGQ